MEFTGAAQFEAYGGMTGYANYSSPVGIMPADSIINITAFSGARVLCTIPLGTTYP